MAKQVTKSFRVELVNALETHAKDDSLGPLDVATQAFRSLNVPGISDQLCNISRKFPMGVQNALLTARAHGHPNADAAAEAPTRRMVVYFFNSEDASKLPSLVNADINKGAMLTVPAAVSSFAADLAPNTVRDIDGYRVGLSLDPVCTKTPIYVPEHMAASATACTETFPLAKSTDHVVPQRGFWVVQHIDGKYQAGTRAFIASDIIGSSWGAYEIPMEVDDRLDTSPMLRESVFESHMPAYNLPLYNTAYANEHVKQNLPIAHIEMGLRADPRTDVVERAAKHSNLVVAPSIGLCVTCAPKASDFSVDIPREIAIGNEIAKRRGGPLRRSVCSRAALKENAFTESALARAFAAIKRDAVTTADTDVFSGAIRGQGKVARDIASSAEYDWHRIGEYLLASTITSFLNVHSRGLFTNNHPLSLAALFFATDTDYTGLGGGGSTSTSTDIWKYEDVEKYYQYATSSTTNDLPKVKKTWRAKLLGKISAKYHTFKFRAVHRGIFLPTVYELLTHTSGLPDLALNDENVCKLIHRPINEILAESAPTTHKDAVKLISKYLVSTGLLAPPGKLFFPTQTNNVVLLLSFGIDLFDELAQKTASQYFPRSVSVQRAVAEFLEATAIEPIKRLSFSKLVVRHTLDDQLTFLEEATVYSPDAFLVPTEPNHITRLVSEYETALATVATPPLSATTLVPSLPASPTAIVVPGVPAVSSAIEGSAKHTLVHPRKRTADDIARWITTPASTELRQQLHAAMAKQNQAPAMIAASMEAARTGAAVAGLQAGQPAKTAPADLVGQTAEERIGAQLKEILLIDHVAYYETTGFTLFVRVKPGSSPILFESLYVAFDADDKSVGCSFYHAPTLVFGAFRVEQASVVPLTEADGRRISASILDAITALAEKDIEDLNCGITNSLLGSAAKYKFNADDLNAARNPLPAIRTPNRDRIDEALKRINGQPLYPLRTSTSEPGLPMLTITASEDSVYVVAFVAQPGAEPRTATLVFDHAFEGGQYRVLGDSVPVAPVRVHNCGKYVMVQYLGQEWISENDAKQFKAVQEDSTFVEPNINALVIAANITLDARSALNEQAFGGDKQALLRYLKNTLAFDKTKADHPNAMTICPYDEEVIGWPVGRPYHGGRHGGGYRHHGGYRHGGYYPYGYYPGPLSSILGLFSPYRYGYAPYYGSYW